MSGNPREQSKKVALSGILCALSVIMMLLGAVIPIAVFMAPMLAGICLMPVALEMDAKTALISYIGVSILSFFLIADREMVLFFIFLMGYYPILQPKLERIKPSFIRNIVKFIIFNASVIIVYAILLFLFASPLLREEFAGQSRWFWGMVLVVGNITFFLYDLLIRKLKIIYLYKFRGSIFK